MEKDKGLLSQKTKQIIKRIILSILSKLLIISLPIIVTLSIISAAIWYINEEEGTWRDEDNGNPGMYTNNTTLSSTNGIEVDKEKLIKEALLSKGYSQERIDSMTEQEIVEYVDTEEPYDKAGAYAIQSCFAKYIDEIEGNYMSVIGLPIDKIYKILKENEIL